MTDVITKQITADKAISFYKKGYNSAQSILAAYAEQLNLDEGRAKAMAAGFGAGIGTMQNTCGVLSGATLVLGCYCCSDDNFFENRQETYRKTQFFVKTFEKKFHGISCLDLMGVDFHEPGGLRKVRQEHLFENRCETFIRYSCKILDKLLDDRE